MQQRCGLLRMTEYLPSFAHFWTKPNSMGFIPKPASPPRRDILPRLDLESIICVFLSWTLRCVS